MQPEWETYIGLGAVVYEFNTVRGFLPGAFDYHSMDAIRSMHADFYDLPDNTRDKTSADSSNTTEIMEEEVTINECEQ